jgi:2-oxo-4-hydroxy-4-carboxy-5-ureidoimidazoline decarboxylase
VNELIPGETTLQQFQTTYGDVCEHSPWIAAAVYQRLRNAAPWGEAELQDAFRQVITGSGEQIQLALLRAHPELATALSNPNLAAASSAEQIGAGLDHCNAEQFAEFQRLNRQYRDTFGFPFIIAVRGHDRESILSAFRQRIDHPQQQEFDMALEQVLKIVAFRIKERFGDINGRPLDNHD